MIPLPLNPQAPAGHPDASYASLMDLHELLKDQVEGFKPLPREYARAQLHCTSLALLAEASQLLESQPTIEAVRLNPQYGQGKPSGVGIRVQRRWHQIQSEPDTLTALVGRQLNEKEGQNDAPVLAWNAFHTDNHRQAMDDVVHALGQEHPLVRQAVEQAQAGYAQRLAAAFPTPTELDPAVEEAVTSWLSHLNAHWIRVLDPQWFKDLDTSLSWQTMDLLRLQLSGEPMQRDLLVRSAMVAVSPWPLIETTARKLFRLQAQLPQAPEASSKPRM